MFVVHKNFSETESLIYMPYEMEPLPEKGAIVDGCDRRGEPVCRARIEKVIKSKRLRKTPVIGAAVPKAYFEIVRAVRF